MFIASHKKPLQFHPISTHSRVSSNELIKKSLKIKKHPFNPELSSKTHLSLFLNYSKTDLILPIPPTLFLLKSINKQILFYNKAGELHIEEGPSTYTKFLNLTNTQEVHKYRHPKFIAFYDSGISLLQEAEDIKQLISNDNQICIQKFIVTDKFFSSKLRIFWHKDKGFNYWAVNNKNSKPKTQWFQEESMKKVQSSYMFKVNDFYYAGRLLKTSMSPFNLYSSKIRKIVSQRDTVKNSEIIRRCSHVKSIYPLNFYLAKQSDPENSSNCKMFLSYPKLEFIILNILSSVEKWVDNLETREIKKASFDFIEDRKGKWVLIGCKFQDIDFESHLQSISMTKVSVDGKIMIKEKKFDEGKEQNEMYSQKILHFKNRIQNLSVKSAKYIDLDKSTMIAFYRPINKESNSSEWNSMKTDVEISPIARQYDSTIMKARELKKKSQQYSELSKEYLIKGNEISEIIEEIIDSISQNSHFSISTSSNTKLTNFKDFLNNHLQGLSSSQKPSNNQILKNLGITNRNFQEFITTLNSILQSHYESHIKEIILENIILTSGFT